MYWIDWPRAVALLASDLFCGVLSATIFDRRLRNLVTALPIIIAAGWVMGLWVIFVPDAKHYSNPQSIALETRLLIIWLAAVILTYAGGFAIQPRLYNRQSQ